MSLRAGFLALFTVLAVVPLMAVGIVDYVHSTRALENLIAEQVEPSLDRSVSGLQERTDRFLAKVKLKREDASPPVP